MVLDCHIHITGKMDPPEVFRQKREAAGVDGGIVFSYQPACFDNRTAEKGDSKRRLDEVLAYTKGQKELYPFYYIDPMEQDALDQVDEAAAAGIAGFKIICGHHYPQDDRAMKVYERIASRKKPLLFHSGILYNDSPSAEYNRPGNFEHLFYIPGLRFAMAHISWPWVDELVAVYGKWNYWKLEAESTRVSAELFVDLTPGTPPIYREEALTKLLTVGYPSLPGHMIFGTDGSSSYDSAHIAKVIAADRAIYAKLGISSEQQEAIFAGNLKKFLAPME